MRPPLICGHALQLGLRLALAGEVRGETLLDP
jgi:hypothetical protein